MLLCYKKCYIETTHNQNSLLKTGCFLFWPKSSQSKFTDINTKVRRERVLQNLICLVSNGENI